MKKKILVLFVGLVMVLMLCACDSEEVKQAKEAYANGDYAKAVELLSKEKELNQDAQDILIISEANVLYEDGKCFEAVKKLATSSQGVQAEQFDEMYQAALDEAIAKPSSDNVIELLALDETKEDTVYKAVTKACKSKDYNAFRTLGGLVKKLPDGDLKTKLSDFKKDNEILKAESFIVGTWEWQMEDQEELARVEVVPYNDNFVGRLVRVGSDLDDYHYEKDDVYWRDFQFEDNDKFICYNLTRTPEGDVMGETASGKINYKKGKIELNVTGASDPLRTWKRIDD